jgi:hypothetical protein
VQHISVGCSVAQEGAAWLSKMQNSSVGCSVAQEGAENSVGCSIAIYDATKLSRVQRITDVCEGWGEGRGILNFKASERSCGKIFSGKVNLLFFLNEQEAAKLRSAVSSWRVYEPPKVGKDDF